jgi:hypothetical protein
MVVIASNGGARVLGFESIDQHLQTAASALDHRTEFPTVGNGHADASDH